MPAVYDSEELANAEAKPQKPQASVGEEHEQTVGAGYTGGGSQLSRLSLRGRLTRRRAIFGGSIIAAIIFLIITFLANGPLEFIHIAQLMDRYHFSHQEDAGDDRMGRLYRYMRSGGNAGETRLGYLGSKMTANMLADLEKIGLKPVFTSKTNVYQGFEIDTENERSPYRGMKPEEIEQALKDKGINPKEITREGKTIKVTVKGYTQQRRSLKFLVDESGKSRISSAVRVRVLSRYGLVTWHPLKVLDRKTNEKISVLYDKWKSARDDRLKTGQQAGSVDPNGAKEEVTDEKGNKSLVDSPAEKTNNLKGVFKEIAESKKLKIAGGLSAGVGAVCLVREVNNNIGEIRYIQVIAPLTRVGMEAVTVGNQIMSGEDVSSTEVSFLAKNFSGVDENGKKTVWSQAKPILAQQGIAGGTDITATKSGQALKESIGRGAPSWISWAGRDEFGPLCSTAGQIAAGTINFVVAIFSGGTASLAGQAAAGFLIGPLVIDKLSAFLAGEAVDIATTGAQWGNYVDYGSRLAANSMALLFGGTALTSAQEAQLNAEESIASQKEFQSKNVAYKLFNAYDQRSAISKLIDNSGSGLTQNFSKFASTIWHFGSIFSSLPKVFANTAQAAPLPYVYGFPAYGFSQDDLNNPAIADPYTNADAAAAILNSPNGQDYIDKVAKCFGVSISKTSQGWDVIPSAGDKPVNPYDPNPSHYPDDCSSPSGLSKDSWLKIRFFIMDTGIIEGYACYQGDELSCSNNGIGIGPPTSPAPADTNVSGAIPELAQQILNSPNINLGCRHCKEDIQNTAQGQPAYASVTLDIGILQFLLDAADRGSVIVTSITGAGSGHSSGSNHYSGHAVDLGCTGVGLQLELLNKTASKYNGKNNGERCDQPNPYGNPPHDHYDFFN